MKSGLNRRPRWPCLLHRRNPTAGYGAFSFESATEASAGEDEAIETAPQPIVVEAIAETDTAEPASDAAKEDASAQTTAELVVVEEAKPVLATEETTAEVGKTEAMTAEAAPKATTSCVPTSPPSSTPTTSPSG